MINFGICFSKEFVGTSPLSHVGKKLPVYLRLLEFCQKEGWETHVLTRRTYKGDGIFEGCLIFKDGKFTQINNRVKINIIYDRTGGAEFPPEGENINVVNNREFMLLCWNKWAAYRQIGKYMPKTLWLGKITSKLEEVVKEIKTENVVIKPFNGLKGIDVFIGSKEEALVHKFNDKEYIAQEFVDTSEGITGVVNGMHDLRVAIINNKIVWSHIRIPPKGSYAANVAQGGTLKEIDIDRIPGSVKSVVKKISEKFYAAYDNPAYSIDFGIEKGKAKVFEINDTIGFPTWQMKSRDNFLKELVNTFKSKLL